MKNCKVGVVLVPSIFGPSRTLNNRAKILRSMGYDAVEVDIYQNHIQYGWPVREKTSPPFILKLVLGNVSRKKRNTSMLAASFEEENLMQLISNSVASLEKKSVDKIVLLGYGLGATVCLRYLQVKINKNIKLAILWYPHLILGKVFTKYASKKSIKQPTHISDSKSNIIFFHGGDDDIVDSKNLEKLKKLVASNSSSFVLRIFRGARHVFAEPFLQGNFPNLLYYWFSPAAWKANRESWEIAIREIKKIADA